MALFRKKIKDPVLGTAEVVSCTTHRGDGAYQNCRLQLVVHVEGRQAYPAELRQILPRKKWPQPGFSVPVIVSRNDPHELKIDTDAMPTNDERAQQLAQEQANWVNHPDAAHAHPAPNVHVIGSIDNAATPDPSTGDDRITQLERLAHLHASGALTDDEFAAEKARILGS